MKRLSALAVVLLSLGAVGQQDDAGTEPVVAPERVEQADAAGESGVDNEAAPETAGLTPRARYNLGIGHLDAGVADAASAEFLAARDAAGPDPELRYRAAFNLALALATGVAADAPPEEAIETLRRSAAWFNDAVRLAPPGDDDARINLELVAKRILVLADQLNEGDRLEARLDRLIDDQRGIRDQVRRLLAEIEAEGAGSEPIGFKSEFDALAVRERTLMAEVGEGIDLATEERLYIEQLPEEQRTPEQQSRAYQLAGVTDYLERARQSLSDARRLLRRLAGERAHRRGDAALAEMKRAREQLFDPVTVLKAVARDELELIDHTQALVAFGDAVRLAQGPPPWLTAKHLAERQQDAAARTGGVLGRFEAIFDARAAAEQPAQDAQQARDLGSVETATPILAAGLDAMRAAIAALEADDSATAVPEQNRAVRALRDTIEQFAGVRDLIELAYAGQQGIVTLLTPDEDSPVAELSTTERASAIAGVADDNVRRLERLEGLLKEEAEAAATASAAEEGEATSPEAEQTREAAARRYELAENLRGKAVDGLAALTEEVTRLEGGAGDVNSARAAAGETLDALAELRRLFFSIVEHLRELHAEQANTHDSTATLQFEASADAVEELAAGLGLAAGRQAEHADLADALAAALAEQADAASTTAAQAVAPQAPGADATAKLAEAAGEVRKAGGRMHSAGALLDEAAARAANMSPELEPALTDQTAAMEHLENALRALSPPDQDQQNQGDGQQQQQQQAQAQREQPQDEEMSQRQALRRLQAIRDREAERQRRRQEKPARSDPVEKDW